MAIDTTREYIICNLVACIQDLEDYRMNTRRLVEGNHLWTAAHMVHTESNLDFRLALLLAESMIVAESFAYVKSHAAAN